MQQIRILFLMQLRVLFVITGTIHVEGGDVNEVRKVPTIDDGTPKRGTEHLTIVQNRDISKDRRRANVITTHYMRELRQIRLWKTPFGTLIHPFRIREARALLEEATQNAAKFNKDSSGCKIANCMLIERLQGVRLAAVEGWLARCLKMKDDDAKSFVTSFDAAEAQNTDAA